MLSSATGISFDRDQRLSSSLVLKMHNFVFLNPVASNRFHSCSIGKKIADRFEKKKRSVNDQCLANQHKHNCQHVKKGIGSIQQFPHSRFWVKAQYPYPTQAVFLDRNFM